MRFYIRLIFALSLMGWGQFVFAVDYSWRPVTAALDFNSPASACDYVTQQAAITLGSPYSTRPDVIYAVTETRWVCRYHVDVNGSPYNKQTVDINRLGDSCPSDSIYNSANGECEAPEPDPCESTIGDRKNHEHKTGLIGGPVSDPPITVCENACQYSNTFENKCYRNFDADKDSLYCSIVYLGNGIQCTGGDVSNPGSVFDQPPTVPPIDRTPEVSHNSNCDNWVTNPDGTLTRSCTSSNEFKEPGSIDCTDGYNIDSCKPGSPPPEYTKTDVSESTTETTNPDGSKTSDTSKTTDKTTCKGLKPCTSTGKTETSTSETGSDGKPGDTSGTCTGTACPEDKDGDGEEDKKEPEERIASAGSCDGAFSCSGDAIDCEILKKQKEQQCFAEDQADFEGNKADIEGLFQGQGDKFTLDEGSGDIDVPSFINQGTRFLPSSCPVAESFSLTTAGGRSFTLSYEPLCRAASDLSGLFVAVATILAALYVGRSVGGN